MSNQIKLLMYALPLLLAVSCDTQEEVFYVGTEPEKTQFLNVDQAQLTFSPEGATYEVNISSIASWEVKLTDNNAQQFTVTPTSGRGDGVLTVTAKSNPTAVSYTANLEISPLNFEMEPVKVVLRQTNTTFSIDTYPSSEMMMEEGGAVNMTAYSSLDWELQVVAHDADGNVGDPEWLTITPGLSGEGKEGNSPTEFRFTWTPNYTNAERTIRFKFMPSVDFQLAEYPREITLHQAAGTLPQSLRCVVEDLDIVNAVTTLEYSSRSPMKDCGIYLYKVDGSGEGELVSTYRPTAEGEYAKNGLYTIRMPELTEDTQFRLVPFAVNEVGMTTGDPREFTTGIKPENMMYDGVKILNADNGAVTAETDITSATLTMVVTSDVEPIDYKIASAVLSVDGKTINGTSTKISDGNYQYSFHATGLTSNKAYDYTITVTSADLPRSQGQMVNKTATVSGTFKTQGRTPGEDDNDKPTTGE